MDEQFEEIAKNFQNKAGENYAASRGEYLNGIIMANYLGYEFVDAAEVIFFEEDGTFDAGRRIVNPRFIFKVLTDLFEFFLQ